MNKLYLGLFQVIMGGRKVARDEENAYGKNTSQCIFALRCEPWMVGGWANSRLNKRSQEVT